MEHYEQTAPPEFENIWAELCARMRATTAFADMPEGDAKESMRRFLCAVLSEWKEGFALYPDFLSALLAYVCLRGEEETQKFVVKILSALSRSSGGPASTDWINEKYAAYPVILAMFDADIHAAAQTEYLAGCEIKRILELERSFLDVAKPDELFSPLIEPMRAYEHAHREYMQLLDECGAALRGAVNSPEVCVRLAMAGDRSQTDGQTFVYFQNGTSVVLLDDELSNEETAESAACKRLGKERHKWLDLQDSFADDQKNELGDSLYMCCFSPEQGCMSGIAFWYWSSDEWSYIDMDIARAHQEKDCDERLITAVIRGGAD